MIVPVFLTHLGCHDRCIYCDQGYITAQNDTDIRRLIQRSLQKKEGAYEVGLFGGNIFGLNPDYLARLFGHFDDYRDRITNFRMVFKILNLLATVKLTQKLFFMLTLLATLTACVL